MLGKDTQEALAPSPLPLILRTRYQSAADFLRHYLPALDNGGIFYPTREAMLGDAPVIVELGFPELGYRLMLRGAVAWRRAGRHRTKLRAGVAIEFAPSEAVRRDFLLAVARGQRPTRNQRRHRRLPTEAPLRWRIATDRTWHEAHLSDVSYGGAFVNSPRLPAVGDDLVLEIVPPGGACPLEVAARPIWHRDEGGFGVEFRWRDSGGARRIRELVRRLEAASGQRS